MVVTIDRDDNFFLNDQPVNIHDLPEKLHQAGVDPAHQSIYLRSDERVSFGTFASVMDAVKQSGITNVSIVTQPLDTKGIGGSSGVAELNLRDSGALSKCSRASARRIEGLGHPAWRARSEEGDRR